MCQVVNGKKQFKVYCDSRDTFDQNTVGIKSFSSSNNVVLVEKKISAFVYCLFLRDFKIVIKW